MRAVAIPAAFVERAASRGRTVTAFARRAAAVIRAAEPKDADSIHALISRYRVEGQLLPRTREEIAAHVGRFVVAAADGEIVGCADLAPLSRGVAEVRSLVVADGAREGGIGRRLVSALVAAATAAGFAKLCAFTHAPAYFAQHGFSIVPHAWVPEKIERDCHGCAQFRHCGQHALVLTLARTANTCVPLASLSGAGTLRAEALHG
jgi:N-acetylglutamate synthase-like GNAT family acetyltransferase